MTDTCACAIAAVAVAAWHRPTWAWAALVVLAVGFALRSRQVV